MRSYGVRLPILAATAWAGIGLSVLGGELAYTETVYIPPTVATFALPTSYVSSDTYVLPTTYSFATYLPAAYIEEPVSLASTRYLTTAYQVRRGLFGRLRLVERPVVASYATTFIPSSFILPTYYTTSYRTTSYIPTTYTATLFDYPRVLPTSYVRTSGAECDPVPCDTPMLASAYRSSTPVSAVESSAGPTYSLPRSGAGSKSASGEMSDDQPIPSTVGPPPGEPNALEPVSEGSKKAAATAGRADSPPEPPLPGRQTSTAAPAVSGAPTQTPAKAAPAVPATAKPAAGSEAVEPDDIKPAPIDNPGSNRRESLRPTYGTTRNIRPELRNVLLGRVESEAGEPLGEVSISVARADNTLIRHTGMTDAFGNFAIRLTDGQWSVNVRMPSGRFHKVRTVTVKNGKIMDNQEQREVRNLVIYY